MRWLLAAVVLSTGPLAVLSATATVGVGAGGGDEEAVGDMMAERAYLEFGPTSAHPTRKRQMGSRWKV
jgi:hypothetical protein